MNIKVKYFNQDLTPIQFIEDNKSDRIDLRCAEPMILKKGDFALIPLGVGMILPDGCEAELTPRSGTFKRYGLIQTNSPGVIDNSYSGNDDQWLMPVYATRDTYIEFDERICQFKIVEKMPRVTIETVAKLNDENRGGFGSTGVK